MHFKEVTEPEIKEKIDNIRSEIESFVKLMFQHHEDHSRPGSKVIHDGVWGTHRYEDYEIALINTPYTETTSNTPDRIYIFNISLNTAHTI